jgi:dephospho-CoA kinase
MQRNGLSRSEVEDILHAQAKREQRLAAADDLIQNDGEISALAPQVALLHQKYCKLAQKVG